MVKTSLTLASVATAQQPTPHRSAASRGDSSFARSLDGAMTARAEKPTSQQTDESGDSSRRSDEQDKAQGSADKAQALPDTAEDEKRVSSSDEQSDADNDDAAGNNADDATHNTSNDAADDDNDDAQPAQHDANAIAAADNARATADRSNADADKHNAQQDKAAQRGDRHAGATQQQQQSAAETNNRPQEQGRSQVTAEQIISRMTSRTNGQGNQRVQLQPQTQDQQSQQGQQRVDKAPDSQDKSDAKQPNTEPKPQPQPTQMPAQHSERVDAAAARAVQVETAIRLENATGQAANVDASLARPGVTAMSGGAGVTGGGVHNGAEHAAQFMQSMPEADESRMTGRVLRGLTTMINQRGGSMSMRLDPPELGQLRVQMTINRGSVQANFIASTQQAHGLLEKNLATLRTALESQGMTVERLNVQLNQSSSTHQQHLNDEQRQEQNQRQQHDAGGGHSRGRRQYEQHQQHSSFPSTASFDGMVMQMQDAAEPTGASQ